MRMTSKERVLRTLAHESPDRVPINYSANAGIDRKLKAHYGLREDDGEGLARVLGVDFRSVGAPHIGPKLHPDFPERGVYSSDWGMRTRWIEHGTGGYWDFCEFPLKDADLETIKNWPMPHPDHYDYSRILEDCERHKDFAIVAGGAGLGDILNSTGMVFGVERTLMDLCMDEEGILHYLDRRLEITYEIQRRIFEAAKGRIDILWIGEDLGTQIAPIISLDLFRRHIRPRHQPYIDLAKKYGARVMVHTCGSSSWAYPDFIEMGVDGVDTLQPEATNMSPEYLKKHFGKPLAFCGCISTPCCRRSSTATIWRPRSRRCKISRKWRRALCRSTSICFRSLASACARGSCRSWRWRMPSACCRWRQATAMRILTSPAFTIRSAS